VSQENVEFVHRFYDAFDRHDESALLDLVHPDVEFTSLIQEVEGPFHGHEGLREYLSSLFAAFPDLRAWVDEVQESSENVVAKIRVRASSAAGIATVFNDWQAITVRGGKAVWWAYFRTESEALKAVGLEE
jgi:ketosteroid isomerase-like protein